MNPMTMKQWLRQQITIVDDHVVMSLEFQAYIVKNRHINHVQFKDDFGQVREITINSQMRKDFEKNVLKSIENFPYRWGN